MLSNWRLSFPSERTSVRPVHVAMWSLFHSAKRCFYRNCNCDSLLCIRIILLCTSLYTPLSCKELHYVVTDMLQLHFVAKTLTHFIRSRIYYCQNGLSTNCLYMIMLKYIVFLIPLLHISSVSALFQMDCLKYKTKRIRKLTPKLINIDNH